MRVVRLLFAFVLLSFALGCGGGESAPPLSGGSGGAGGDGGREDPGGGGDGGLDGPGGSGGLAGAGEDGGTGGAGAAGGIGGSGGAGGLPEPEEECLPGETRPCYTGPEGTEGVGSCRAGEQLCLPDGSGFSACLGEKVPTRGPDACGEDGCPPETCIYAACGNGALEPGEECDEGEENGEARACSLKCRNQRVFQISAGFDHNCAVLEGGTLKCWGGDLIFPGKLGLGDLRSRGASPEDMGSGLPFVDLGHGAKVREIALGPRHSCALLEPGALKCWGVSTAIASLRDRGGREGEMGDALPFIDLGSDAVVLSLSASFEHNCALLEGGSVKCWGSNQTGELGTGDSDERGSDPNKMGDNLLPVNLGAGAKAIAVATGDSHSCAILEGGGVKCWGWNAYGALGMDVTGVWGYIPQHMGDNLPFVSLGDGAQAVAVTAGYFYTCVLLADGSVKCWGRNEEGELGLGDTIDRGRSPSDMGNNLPAVNLGSGVKATAISAGASHTCALLEGGSIKCWGDATSGKLGLGDERSRGVSTADMGDALPAVNLGPGRTAISVAAGGRHTCALLDDATVKCWGEGGASLGLGDSDNRGDAPGQMGSLLPRVRLY